MKNVLLAALLALPALCATTPGEAAMPVPTGFLNKTLQFEGKAHPYVVYVPVNYTSEHEWPVILFLHGAGERGEDGLKQTQVGLGAAVRMNLERFPALVVMPQCLTGERWQGNMADLALRTLDQTMSEYRCDPDRQYLTGLSMGGFGSFVIASQYPDRFAAVAPICGGGNPEEMAPRLQRVRLWVFHGANDEVVPPGRSREMVEAIRKAGGEHLRYTEYPGVGHNSWDRAYGDPEFAQWLLAQRR
jgi:predicted peptidase